MINYDIGQTWIRINNEAIVRLVIFGGEDNTILGADTLEGFGLGVDPVGKRLIPVEGLLM